MLLHEINACSTLTFQDAENRLNYLESKLDSWEEKEVKPYIIQIGENDENMVEMELTEPELEKFIEFARKIAQQSNNEVLCAVSDKDNIEYFSNALEWMLS